MAPPEFAHTFPLPSRVVSTRLQRKFFRNVKERIVEGILLLAGLSAVATTIAIVCILVYESLGFFQHVSIVEFLTDTQWTPLFSDAHYGILPLVSGTLTVAFVALAVAIPMGTIVAI